MTEEKVMFDGILMLSGGKDSCSLAFKLKEEGLNILGYTVHNGFLSDVALSNVEKTIKACDMDSVIWRPKHGQYQALIDENEDMFETCTKCSSLTINWAVHMALGMGVKKVYAGFTKYTAQAQDWDGIVEKDVMGITMVNPYYEEYDLKRVKKVCKEHGLVFDPTKTNCIHIKDLIDRTPDDPFGREVDLLHKDKQLTAREVKYYKKWIGK